jgi:hypothetical protein
MFKQFGSRRPRLPVPGKRRCFHGELYTTASSLLSIRRLLMLVTFTGASDWIKPHSGA